MKNKIVTFLATISFGASSLLGQSIADINYGSAAALGGGLFQGADGASADSIAIGFFSAAASADLTGWTAFQTDTTFNNATGFSAAAITDVDVTAAVGKDAWILLTDGALSGLVRANDWASWSGVESPGTPGQLVYQFDLNDTAAGVSTLAAVGTTLSVITNGGQGGSSGLGFQLTAAVPEPSAYALLGGLFALGCVMLRRRA
jgi:hypothetical protein